MTDTILSQVGNRFKDVKAVIAMYRIVQSYFLVRSTKAELLDKSNKSVQRFSDMYHHCLSHSCYIRSAFRSELDHFKNVEQLANLCLIEISFLISSCPDIITNSLMCLTGPVTVAKAETNKNVLQSTMIQ